MSPRFCASIAARGEDRPARARRRVRHRAAGDALAAGPGGDTADEAPFVRRAAMALPLGGKACFAARAWIGDVLAPPIMRALVVQAAPACSADTPAIGVGPAGASSVVADLAGARVFARAAVARVVLQVDARAVAARVPARVVALTAVKRARARVDAGVAAEALSERALADRALAREPRATSALALTRHERARARSARRRARGLAPSRVDERIIGPTGPAAGGGKPERSGRNEEDAKRKPAHDDPPTMSHRRPPEWGRQRRCSPAARDHPRSRDRLPRLEDRGRGPGVQALFYYFYYFFAPPRTMCPMARAGCLPVSFDALTELRSS